MRQSIVRVSAFSIALVFFSWAILFAAPKSAKTIEKKGKVNQTSNAPVEKAAPVTENEPIKDATQSVIEIPAGQITESPSVVTPALTPQAVSNKAAIYSIDWFVIAAGGGSGTSTNYSMDGTVGQTAVGEGTSTNYELNSGFWQNFGPPDCCVSPRGDYNDDGTNANILDLTFLVDRIFRGGPPASCPKEADINSDGTPSNILDLTFLVDRIFRGGPPPGAC
jgi:hypothetical protein